MSTLITTTDDTLVLDGQRWPVVDGIPWLRHGRDEVRERALAAIDAGDRDGAAIVLLADADDWWDAPPPEPDRLRAALRARTMRAAVDLLGFGRVGTYFLHRWSDPTWLATLALTAAHPPAGRPVVDLACGAGHLLRQLALHGERDLLGVDVVFAKLWLARRFVLPGLQVRLVCADLSQPWPLPAPTGPAYVACHDALYFLDDKAALVSAARSYAGARGAVVLGHCHNASHPGGRAGRPLPGPSWPGLLAGSTAYAEEELTAAALEGRIARPAAAGDLAGTEAVGLVADAGGADPDPSLLLPASGAALRVNPLYVDDRRTWPGDAWEREYAERVAGYLPERRPHGIDREIAVRHRVLVDLPESW